MTWNPKARLDELAPKPNLGDGISRPAGNRPTREYRVQVRCKGVRPLMVCMLAENKRSAIRYCKNRWPGSTVEVIA
jgi:hypothetical protein